MDASLFILKVVTVSVIRNIVHAAAEHVEQISPATGGQSCCAGVFIDLKKAFDTVDQELLVEKLNVYGISGVANKWLQNHLTKLI